MAMIDTTRPAPAAPEAATGAQDAADPARAPLVAGPAAWQVGQGAEDRLIAQVAFALAAERGLTEPPNAEAAEAMRGQAIGALSDFAFRYLHNRADEIRQDAAAEAAAKAGRPITFGRLVLANLVALALVWGLTVVLALHPDRIAARIGL
jgi:hypothetical protein